MADSAAAGRRYAIPPLHSVVLASMVPLFLGAVLSNWAYARTYEIQWTNFASWLVAGGMVFAVLALVWALVDLFARRARPAVWLHLLLVLATCVAGLLASLLLARDAWAAMPGGQVLSIIALLLAVAANWSAHTARFRGAAA